jgi:hypothetical protein
MVINAETGLANTPLTAEQVAQVLGTSLSNLELKAGSEQRLRIFEETAKGLAARGDIVEQFVRASEHSEVLYRLLLHAYLKLGEQTHKLQEVNRDLELHEVMEILYRKQLAIYTVLDRRHNRRAAKLERGDRRCKLTSKQVSEMRLAWNNGRGVSINKLAERYGRAVSTVWKIVHGRCWKNPIR